MQAEPRLEAFQIVVAYQLHVRAYTDGAYVIVFCDKGINGTVGRFIERGILYLVHHFIDVLFFARKLIGPRLIPICVVLVIGIFKHLYFTVRHLHVFNRDGAEVDIGIIELPGADDRHHPRRITQGDRKVGV